MNNPSYAVRRAIAGTSGMISAGHHLISLAGLDVLRSGGGAVDAAVAASAVACVILPHACGIGGDAFAVGFDALTQNVWALNASGRAPASVTASSFPHGIDAESVASATVPGIVHGWTLLLEKYGSRSLRQLLEPAIGHASSGFPINDVLSMLIVSNLTKLEKHPESAKLLLPQGQPLPKGALLRQPALAESLRQIALGGSQSFYEGDAAREICRYGSSVGGYFEPGDFASHRSTWERQPLTAHYHGYDVFVSPPNSIAMLLLAQLKLLSKQELARMEHNSGEYMECMIRSKRTAFQRVLPQIADLHRMRIDPASLLSSGFLNDPEPQSRKTSVDGTETADTTTITVVDRDGNCVSLVQSVFHHFGCGAIAGNSGIFLNNRMSGFSLDAKSPNCVEGGQRPAHTLSPALVLKGQKPRLVIATPGAYAQTQSLCQVLNNILVYNMELQEALEVPRWFDDIDDSLLCENRIGLEAISRLVEDGYKVKLGSPWEAKTGSVQCISIEGEEENRLFFGAADPRRHGSALGW
jgi:gamma-glutamyltranspeptidase / glutathione hydrolase